MAIDDVSVEYTGTKLTYSYFKMVSSYNSFTVGPTLRPTESMAPTISAAPTVTSHPTNKPTPRPSAGNVSCATLKFR